MDITIHKATLDHLADCEQAVIHSRIGDIYFQGDRANKCLTDGITKEEIFVAVDATGEALGFIWYDLNGTFYRFPYVRLIAVRQEHRGKGIGKVLLDHFEAIAAEHANAFFLLVSDFNPDAKRLYEKIGYVQVGEIPDVFKEGVAECLMMKRIR